MLTAILIAVSLSSAVGQSVPLDPGQVFEVAAQHKQVFGGARGTLIINNVGIEFRGPAKQSYAWAYSDLRGIRILSASRLTVETYRGPARHRRLGNGPGPSYSFDLKDALPGGAVQYLLSHFSRPIATAVLPPLPADARDRVAVKLRRDEGELLLYDEGLAYVTDGAQASRFWRFSDLYSVLRLDRYHLLVVSFDGDASRTRTFSFELKTELPPGMYDALWHHLNPFTR